MRTAPFAVLFAAALIACANDRPAPTPDSAATLSASRDSTVEGFIPVPGGKVWYRVVGADKPGTPLLTLHGGPGMLGLAVVESE